MNAKNPMNNIQSLRSDFSAKKIKSELPQKIERQERWMRLGGLIGLLVLLGVS